MNVSHVEVPRIGQPHSRSSPHACISAGRAAVAHNARGQLGSVDTIVEQLHAWREQCDVSYFIVPSRLMDGLAPVIARVAGT